MTNLELFKEMLKYYENTSNFHFGLCNVQNIVRYNSRVTKAQENIIKQYKPTWRSKFWWTSWRLIFGKPHWWALNEKGRAKRIKFLKHLISKLEKDKLKAND